MEVPPASSFLVVLLGLVACIVTWPGWRGVRCRADGSPCRRYWSPGGARRGLSAAPQRPPRDRYRLVGLPFIVAGIGRGAWIGLQVDHGQGKLLLARAPRNPGSRLWRYSSSWSIWSVRRSAGPGPSRQGHRARPDDPRQLPRRRNAGCWCAAATRRGTTSKAVLRPPPQRGVRRCPGACTLPPARHDLPEPSPRRRKGAASSPAPAAAIAAAAAWSAPMSLTTRASGSRPTRRAGRPTAAPCMPAPRHRPDRAALSQGPPELHDAPHRPARLGPVRAHLVGRALDHVAREIRRRRDQYGDAAFLDASRSGNTSARTASASRSTCSTSSAAARSSGPTCRPRPRSSPLA